MRQWRVGTLSMGLLLVGSGIGLLYAQFNKLAVVDLAMKWWPLIFILLGVEVLVQYYFRKDIDNKIKYDVFSIFIILIIVVTGVVIQTTSELGLSAYLQSEIRAQNFELTSPTTKVDASKARSIVIHAESAPHLVVRDSSAKEISIYGRGNIRAESREMAVKQLAEGVQVSSRQEGDILYVDLEAGLYLSNYYLTLPGDIAAEFDLNGTSAELSPVSLSNNWLVKGGSDTRVTLLPDTNLQINLLDTNLDTIHGNVSWVDRNGKTLVELRQEKQAQQINGEMNENYNEDSDQLMELKTVVGKPDHKLTLVGPSEVSVNVLP
ncbi:MAG: hypothetical protein ACM3PE_13170 [Deltaproteobacteria bacterium]